MTNEEIGAKLDEILAALAARPPASMPTGEILTLAELNLVAGGGSPRWSERQLYRLLKRREFRAFEVKRPMGKYRYSRALVLQFLGGDSAVQFRRGRS